MDTSEITNRTLPRYRWNRERQNISNILRLDMLTPEDMDKKIDRQILKNISVKRKYHVGLGVPAMSEELADELHKPIRKHFEKRRVISKHVDDIWAADLVDMQYYSRSNKGYKYILMIIDVFSKYGWAIPLKTKTGVEVSKAFADLWKKQKPPKYLWTDKGKEFINKHMNELLVKYNVHLYWTENEEKSSVVERWNRTIKSKMWKYFTQNRTGVYIDILPTLIENYNNTYHRSIKSKPSDAREPSNYQDVFNALYNNIDLGTKSLLKPSPKFKIGDQVRISKLKRKFEKGYTANWTEEVFTIEKIQTTIPYTYKLKDTKNEAVQGTFYEPELQLAKQTSFRIEKVLRRRTTKDGKKEIYVKWLGYTPAFNQWIPASDLE